MKFSRYQRFAAAAAAALLCTAIVGTNVYDKTVQSLKRPDMNPLSSRLHPLFEKTKTVCFGHFILEVPRSAVVIHGPTNIDSPIEFYPGEAHKLAQHVEGQLAEIEKDRFLLSEADVVRFPLFGKVIEGAVPGQRLVFGSKDQAFYSIYSVIPMGDDLFVQHLPTGVTKDDAVRSFNSVAKHLRLRAVDEVPAEAGSCIEGGFVSWQPEFEKASVGIRLKEFPDVHFSVEVIKNQDYLVESSALEPRLKRAEADGGSWYTRVKFFRRGPRELGNWKGFEALARKPAQEGNTESHQFAFVSLGALHDPLQPSLDIQLDTGVKDDKTASVAPSLTDEEAVALWDKLISSIRVRPSGDPAKQSNATPAKMPLGEFVDSGNVCPQTGWWQCSDSGVVSGGRRRHFLAGQPMPNAVLLGKPSVWQIATGQRPSQEIATVWELVEYDPDRTEAGPLPVGGTHDSAPRSES